MTRSTIYVASKIKYAQMWRTFRDKGHNIISTWIDEADKEQTETLAELSKRCVEEAYKADYTIFYAKADEEPKMAIVELGAALAGMGIVIVVRDGELCKALLQSTTILAHPKIQLVEGLDVALRYIKAMDGAKDKYILNSDL